MNQLAFCKRFLKILNYYPIPIDTSYYFYIWFCYIKKIEKYRSIFIFKQAVVNTLLLTRKYTFRKPPLWIIFSRQQVARLQHVRGFKLKVRHYHHYVLVNVLYNFLNKVQVEDLGLRSIQSLKSQYETDTRKAKRSCNGT